MMKKGAGSTDALQISSILIISPLDLAPFRAWDFGAEDLRNDLRGLPNGGVGGRREHGEGGDEGVKLGHVLGSNSVNRSTALR
jgi:hypothetical protein